MALIVADRVLETSTTTGAGVLTLAGAVNGDFRAASSVCVNADIFYYYIEGVDGLGNPDGSGWETGLATWGTGNTFTRTIVYDGSNGTSPVVWAAGTRRIALALTAAFINTLLSKSGGTLTGALNYAATVTVASAATTDIGAAASNTVIVSGTTTITSLGTIAAGAERCVQFSGALTLTHNAASLILPGVVSILTATGDVAYFVSLGAGNWRCTGYQRASGQAIISSGGGTSAPSLTILTSQLFGGF